jgi:hypothetical protein
LGLDGLWLDRLPLDRLWLGLDRLGLDRLGLDRLGLGLDRLELDGRRRRLRPWWRIGRPRIGHCLRRRDSLGWRLRCAGDRRRRYLDGRQRLRRRPPFAGRTLGLTREPRTLALLVASLRTHAVSDADDRLARAVR